MAHWCGARSLLRRRLRAVAGAAVFAAMMLAGAPALAGLRLTPRPSLASIPPQPAAPGSYAARVVATLPPYVPQSRVSGVIRIWGHGNPKLPWMRHLVTLWEQGFRRFQPGVHLEYRMYGTSSGVPALFTGIGDIALLGEEVLPQEVRAFERARGYRPLVLQIMTGSVAVRNFDYAQQFFVHADNPLTHITLEQLAAIYGAAQESGDSPIRTWGELGLRGRWARQPIRPYSWALDDSFAVYLQQALLGGSHEWSCALRTYRHIYLPDGSIYDHGQQILDALAQDPDGIAVSNIRYAGAAVKPLALGVSADGPFYQATERTLIEGLYPLARTLPAVVDVPPGGKLDPKVREFLRYLLSRDGQEAVNEDGRYLPLAPALLAAQLHKLPPAVTAATAARAAKAATATAVSPRAGGPQPPGALRIWGPPSMGAVVERWATGFHRLHPEVTVEPRLMGSDTAIPGLYSGRADIALLGRRDDETDDNGFSRPKGYRFTRLELMNGSLGTEGQSAALAVLVNSENPVSRLTVAQIRRMAGCSCGPKAATPPTWGDFGAPGAWASRPVHVYLMDIDSGTGAHFVRAVMGGSTALDWSRVREFHDVRSVNGSSQTAAALAAAALRQDPDGIAVSNVRYARTGLKVLAVAAQSGGPFILPTRSSIIAGTYPLARRAYAFIDRAPGKPIEPRVSQFLQYVLSPSGQADIGRVGGYLPLARGKRAEELAALTGAAATPANYALEVADSLPAYRPRQQVAGTIRLWGHGSPKHDFMGKLLRRWERDFHEYQPHVRIVDDLYGSASAVGALYTGAGDLAILGEEVSPAAEKAFERERHYAPTLFEVATGSVDVNYYDYAHMVFVNRANPLDRLTMPQLARILGDPPRGRSGAIGTWGALGLQGPWADRRIQAYSWRFDQDFGLFLRARVLAGSDRWNPGVREFVTYNRPDGTIDDRGEQILQALARDPDGMAVSNIRFTNPSVKIVSLAATSSGPYVLPSVETLISQRYPLTRIIPAVVDLPPGQPIDPAIREFLRFILSRAGQRALVAESGYLPLGPKYVRAQLQKVDDLSRCAAAGGCPPTSRQDRAMTTLQREEAASSPGHPLDGLIRVWGNPGFQTRAQRWAEHFRASNPQDRITLHMTGSDTGMAGLYTGEADMALLGRPATDSELQAFEWVFRHPPSCIDIAASPLAVPGKTPRGDSLYVYLNSGRGAQPLAPAFLHSILSQSGRSGHSCASTR